MNEWVEVNLLWRGVDLDDYPEAPDLHERAKHLGVIYDSWYPHQPEVIAYNEKVKELDSRFEQSFVGRKLNKPGTQIECLGSDGVIQLLIGDISSSGGICTECCEIDPETIVKRYRNLLD